jgi:hypothetical protein
MLKNLVDYWWIPVKVLYFLPLAVVIRRGFWATREEQIC